MAREETDFVVMAIYLSLLSRFTLFHFFSPDLNVCINMLILCTCRGDMLFVFILRL